MSYLLVFVGAGIGGMLRYLVSLVTLRFVGLGFPWPTFLINVTGSFAMGLLAAWLVLRLGSEWSERIRLFAATGILGGYTTFSSFSLEAFTLWERGEAAAAIFYVTGSVVVGITALVAGFAIVKGFP